MKPVAMYHHRGRPEKGWEFRTGHRGGGTRRPVRRLWQPGWAQRSTEKRMASTLVHSQTRRNAFCCRRSSSLFRTRVLSLSLLLSRFFSSLLPRWSSNSGIVLPLIMQALFSTHLTSGENLTSSPCPFPSIYTGKCSFCVFPSSRLYASLFLLPSEIFIATRESKIGAVWEFHSANFPRTRIRERNRPSRPVIHVILCSY